MDTSEKLSKIEDDLAYDHFIHDHKRNKDGRYCVGLPWINYQPGIPSNRHVAEKRLFSVTRKLKALNKLEDYSNVFVEWLEEGVIEKVPNEEMELKGHFIPHHPVIKPESLTTKIRPVFDASCKMERTPSLNECLASGPNLIEQIPSIFLRFREKAIGVIADIRRAFLQIEVKEEDRNYLKFLWWEKENKVQVFRHKRVVFGVTCSPFLLGAVIRHHLLNVPDKFVSVAKKLLESFYTDNCVASVEDGVQLKDFITKSTDIFSQAKMDLRMWQFGPLSIVDSDSLKNANLLQEEVSTTVPVLGLKWDRKDETLMIGSKIELKTANVSKRGILSITQRIFDPIGLFIPVVLPAKLLIQKTWANKSGWDDPIPGNIRDEFLIWYNALNMLNAIKIPRRVGYGDRTKWSVHVCCDASQKSYAAVIFLRCEETDKVFVQLLMAKSRLAPLKRISISRLELLACVLGARLCHFIVEALDIHTITTYFWTDSSTTLAWIQRNDQWGTFVGNRVKEICQLSKAQQFVPGHLNPADLPSRGCNPQQFLRIKWWEGPA